LLQDGGLRVDDAVLVERAGVLCISAPDDFVLDGFDSGRRVRPSVHRFCARSLVALAGNCTETQKEYLKRTARKTCAIC